MGANDSRERAILDSQFGSGTPTTWYFGLSKTTPNDDGSGFVEPSGANYGRVAYANNATNFPAATTSGGITTKTNGNNIKWPDPTGTWGELKYYGIFTSASGGTPEYVAPLDASITPKAGNTPVQFDAGGLILTCD